MFNNKNIHISKCMRKAANAFIWLQVIRLFFYVAAAFLNLFYFISVFPFAYTLFIYSIFSSLNFFFSLSLSLSPQSFVIGLEVVLIFSTTYLRKEKLYQVHHMTRAILFSWWHFMLYGCFSLYSLVTGCYQELFLCWFCCSKELCWGNM